MFRVPSATRVFGVKELVSALKPDISTCTLLVLLFSVILSAILFATKLVLRLSHQNFRAQHVLDSAAYLLSALRASWICWHALHVPDHKRREFNTFSGLFADAVCGFSSPIVVELLITSGLGFACQSIAFVQVWKGDAGVEFMLFCQALEYFINLPMVVILDNSWTQIKTVLQLMQVAIFVTIVYDIVLHVSYSAGDQGIGEERFNALRLASLGSLLFYRIFLFQFFKFKSDFPRERFCIPQHRQLEGLPDVEMAEPPAGESCMDTPATIKDLELPTLDKA